MRVPCFRPLGLLVVKEADTLEVSIAGEAENISEGDSCSKFPS